MQKQYSVNLELRERLIKEMKNKQKAHMTIWNIFQLMSWCTIIAVVLTAVAWLMPVVIESIKAGYIGEALLTLVALIPVFAVTSVIWLIILFFKTHKEKKYLSPWISYTDEHLWLHRKSMEWKYCNRFNGQYYWVLQMKYEDIRLIEYDEEQHLLRIYGPYSGKKWDSIRQNSCLDSFDICTDTKTDDHFVFCDYYENFDQLIRDLEEISGKQVIVKNTSFRN